MIIIIVYFGIVVNVYLSGAIGSDYDGYFEVLPIVVGRSQSLFWSGVLELVGMVSCMCSSGANVVSSANTPSSAIFNGIGNINWCGTTDPSSNGESQNDIILKIDQSFKLGAAAQTRCINNLR